MYVNEQYVEFEKKIQSELGFIIDENFVGLVHVLLASGAHVLGHGGGEHHNLAKYVQYHAK